jgi:glycosyltransferase involved in cell wall biosynthesis
MRALATARVLLFTTPMAAFYTKREGQRVVVAFDTLNAGEGSLKAFTRAFFLADVLLPVSQQAKADVCAAFSRSPSLLAKVQEGGLEACTLEAPPARPTTPHLLFYVDTLKLNGITASLMNLLHLLVASGVEVTLMTQQRQALQQGGALRQFPEGVPLLLRAPAHHLTLKEALGYALFQRKGRRSWLGRWAEKARFWYEEARRMVGDTAFSCAIEYSGYTASGAMLMLVMQAQRHLIWAHADMMSEYQLKHPRLGAVFSLYDSFDALVSCSEALCEVNARALANPKVTFTSCKNALNLRRVREGLAASKMVHGEDQSWLFAKAEVDGPERAIPLSITRPDGTIVTPEARFLMVGRLSIEKNLEATLRGFARFLKTGACAKLFIVGEGPLRASLEALIKTLAIEPYVMLVGRLLNPAELMTACDCFLLTSRHEGQPMVVNEARLAGMPILLSNFASHTDVLLPGGQKVVGMDAEAIAGGFEAFMRGERWPYTFDGEAYNQAVVQRFLQCALS